MVAIIFVKLRHIHNVGLKHIIKEYSLRKTLKKSWIKNRLYLEKMEKFRNGGITNVNPER